MKKIKPEAWIPADGMSLEKYALDVITTTGNHLVVAGPGAGKTELLAQKACFLLQTNTCKFPFRILAISFKRDAAFNLKERVRVRCGNELSKRFDSLTFDSFAKQILDRFKQALPNKYKIVSDYEILLKDESILEFYQAENNLFYNSTNRTVIMNLHNAKFPHKVDSEGEIVRNAVWNKMVTSRNSKLSFKMIMRLAEFIIESNPKLKQYLKETYRYIFLDEFQDTTKIQYDLFKTCFLRSDSVFTAVGDDKQRIMLWAGAQPSIFNDFMMDTNANRIPLTMNFRCAPRLVTLLNHLTQHLLGKSDFAKPSNKWQPDQGECFVWFFQDPTSEMQILFREVQNWIRTNGLNPRDFCILVKQQLNRYAGDLIKYFNLNGIKARDENKFQEILTQEVSIFIINVLYTVFQKKSNESKQIVFDFLTNLHTELEDEQLLRLEATLSRFIKKVRKEYNGNPLTDEKIEYLIAEIVNYANKDRIRAYYPSYKNLDSLDRAIADLQQELIGNYHMTNDILLALDMLIGKDTIPVMTIHKSKGLEYHTIIFIGLEDGAFWSFQQQPDEDKCAFFVALSRAKERVVFTFSKKREGRFGIQDQTFENISVLFEELQKSGIALIEEKK